MKGTFSRTNFCFTANLHALTFPANTNENICCGCLCFSFQLSWSSSTLSAEGHLSTQKQVNTEETKESGEHVYKSTAGKWYKSGLCSSLASW